MTQQEIRRVIQDEYDKQKEDTNYNFITRFSVAVHKALQGVKNLNEGTETEPKKIGRHCRKCHKVYDYCKCT